LKKTHKTTAAIVFKFVFLYVYVMQSSNPIPSVHSPAVDCMSNNSFHQFINTICIIETLEFLEKLM